MNLNRGVGVMLAKSISFQGTCRTFLAGCDIFLRIKASFATNQSNALDVAKFASFADTRSSRSFYLRHLLLGFPSCHNLSSLIFPTAVSAGLFFLVI